MKERIIAGIGIIIGVLCVLWLGKPAIHLLTITVVLISSYEVYRIYKDKTPRYILFIILALVILGMYFTLEGIYIYIAISLFTLYLIALLDSRIALKDMNMIFVMILMIIMAYISIEIIVTDYNGLVLFLVLVGTYATDTFAYFGGMLFGKHKLIPRVSPKKTIEGAISGYIFGFIMMFAFGYFYTLEYLPLSMIIVLSITTPFVAQVGDLFFSLIKRDVNIKDYGNLIPGHGGILDRIDSLIFTLMLFTVILNIYVVF